MYRIILENPAAHADLMYFLSIKIDSLELAKNLGSALLMKYKDSKDYAVYILTDEEKLNERGGHYISQKKAQQYLAINNIHTTMKLNSDVGLRSHAKSTTFFKDKKEDDQEILNEQMKFLSCSIL